MWKLILIILGLYYVYYKCVAKWENIAFKKFDIKRKSSEVKIFPNEVTDYNLMIVNNKIFPLLWITLRYELPRGFTIIGEEESFQYKHGEVSVHRTLLSLLFFQKVSQKYKIFFKERGYYSLNKITAETSDYFGFKKISKDIDCPMIFVVYPNIYPLEDLIIKDSSYLGENLVKRWIMDDPTFFSGVREYTFNEPIKQIHWKATAKTGDMQVKVNDYTADMSTLYVLDLGYDRLTNNTDRSPLAERLIEVVAAYMHLSEENQYQYGFATNYLVYGNDIKSTFITPNRGNSHLLNCAEILSRLREYANIGIDNLLYQVSSKVSLSTVISISTHSIDDNLFVALKNLKLKGFEIEINTFEEEIENRPNISCLGKVNLVKRGDLDNGR
ncbi:DUF58 domain-containing protein [Proteinivorax tanatarense]|uniref:DUF58 domain-containing protein n=1 Tax=Proteinivorax tanatarense TaxID=1260629 RepID=A0AAU7VKS9_9FIRM